MSTKLEAAARQALEALISAQADEHRDGPFEYRATVITALREALAEQQAAEPVARCMAHGECFGGECIYPAPTQQPVLVRDLAEILGATVPEVCDALAECGGPRRSTNMAVSGEEALAVAAKLKQAAEPVAAPSRAALAREVARIAGIMRDCGRYVDTSGNGQRTLQSAAAMLDQAPTQQAAPDAYNKKLQRQLEQEWSEVKKLREAEQPAPPQQPLTIGPLARRRIFDYIRGAYDLGYNDARNAKAVPGDGAPGYKGRDVEADHGGALLHALEALGAQTTQQAAEPNAVLVEGFGRVALRKLNDLREKGYAINGVSIATISEAGETNRGAVTTGGMVLWWPQQTAQQAAEPVACDKDPRGCWNVRCQLGGVCKNIHPAPTQQPLMELVEYILQDDLHNRLTPRVIDIAYSAWSLGRSGKNKDDGGPCDWFNDTKPMVTEQLQKIRKDLAEAAHNMTGSKT